jgi:TMEM175 potassium channel family protein
VLLRHNEIGRCRPAHYNVLSIHPYLLEEGIDPDFFPKERLHAIVGVISYAIAGVAGWLLTPKLGLLIFLALSVFYGITSEGLTETRIRLQIERTHRKSLAQSEALGTSGTLAKNS